MTFKILLVEDDQFKKQKILELLHNELTCSNVTSASSVVAAIECIDKKDLDLVLLDLAIPDYDEVADGAQGLGGILVFRYLHQVMPDVPVLVITQFEALTIGARTVDIATIREDLEAEFSNQFLELIQYKPTLDDWKESIKKHVLEKGKI